MIDWNKDEVEKLDAQVVVYETPNDFADDYKFHRLAS